MQGLGITLTNKEIKDIIKVNNFSENRGILLKWTSKKVTGQKRELFRFLGLLMKTSLQLMKIVLAHLAKSVLVPLGLTAAAFVTDAVIKKNKTFLSQEQQH